MASKITLDDICSDECDGRYCILKEFMSQSGFSDRQLTQLKMIEKLKFEESKRQGKDIGWDKAHMLWVDKGYAQKYAELYKPDFSFRELYNKIVLPQ